MVAWEGETGHSAEDLIGRTAEVAGHSKTAVLATRIRGIVAAAGGSIPAKDAYRTLEAEGLDTSSRDNLMRAREQAKVVSKKDGFDGPWIWRLER